MSQRGWIIACLLAFVSLNSFTESTQAQSGRTQYQYAAKQRSQAASSSVSADLLEIYRRTESAKTVTAVTTIARACSNIIPNESRSEVDREYAASLLAWALNRRGELRSERAAELVEAGELQEAGKLDQLAAEDFQTAIEYGPENWRTHHNYAISLAMNGEYEQGIKEFGRSIELKADYPNAYFNRGELFFETGRYREAVKDYSDAIKLNSQDPQFFNSRAHARFMVEDYAAAIEDYTMAAQLVSSDPEFQTDLADALQFLGRWEEAAKAYRVALAQKTKLPRTYQNAAWLMATCPDSKIRNPELAVSAARKAIELAQERTARSLDTLAAATAASGKHNDAVRLQRQAIELAEQDEAGDLQQRLSLYQRGATFQQSQPEGAIRTAGNPSGQTKR